MGKLIAIEGLDAAGKAVQAKILADRIGAKLLSFPRYKTPIGEVIGRLLRKSIHVVSHDVADTDLRDILQGEPEAEALIIQSLMLADRCDAASDFETGTTYVFDRWIPSGLCYGVADGLNPALLEDMHCTLPDADVNIYLRVSEEEMLRRRPNGRDRYERDREKLQRVRANYEKMWAENAGRGYVVVDGEGTIGEVAERVGKAVESCGS